MLDNDVDEDVLKKRVRTAGYCGVISLVFTIVIYSLMGGFSGAAGVDPLYLYFDVALLAVLIYGTFRASRVAATGLLVYFVGSKLLQWQATGSMSGVLVAALFGYFYYQGMMATYELPAIARAMSARLLRNGLCPKCQTTLGTSTNRCGTCGASLTQRHVAAS
jgi:hypothetical protein